MNDLTIINKEGILVVDSREVAEMIGKEHKNLLRDIKVYVDILINADVNGALNILRKYIKGIPKAIEIARDNGRLDSPLRIRGV